jgi:hypothetical protein
MIQRYTFKTNVSLKNKIKTMIKKGFKEKEDINLISIVRRRTIEMKIHVPVVSRYQSHLNDDVDSPDPKDKEPDPPMDFPDSKENAPGRPDKNPDLKGETNSRRGK